MPLLSHSKKKSSRQHRSSTLSDVVAEIQGLRRDMIVLCRVIVESRKLSQASVERRITRAEQPGSLSANVQMPSWYDAIFEQARTQGEE